MTGGTSIVRVLGPVELGDRHLTRQELLLLALLAANHGRVVATERLVDALWPEAPPGWARNRVQSMVSSLRRGLPAGAISTVHTGYVLRIEESGLDAHQFELSLRLARGLRTAGDSRAAARRLEEALNLWRGLAFEDAPIPSVAAQAARLTELRDEAVEELFEIRLMARDGNPVSIADLARHVEAAPLRHRLRGLLMTALHRAGRQAEALEAYRAGARLLSAEYGLDPPPELQHLYDTILRDETPPKSVAVPRQMPAVPADFTGRRKELRLIKSMFLESASDGASLVVSMSGMAGVGKTTLAVRVAHDLSPQFADGCLYANLRGTDEPTPAAQVLGSFLRACGVAADALPSHVDERAALYRTLLAEREVLVVLDNAASEDQVMPLLPGAGGAVLFTSRRPLTGLPGARMVQLEVLTAQDTIELLAAVAGRDRVAVEPDAAQRIARLCGGLPLAVRVAAVRVAAHERLSLEALATRLADERERLDELSLADLDVRASLALSCRQLTGPQSLLWQALCVMPMEDIPAWLVAATLDVTVARADRMLEELAAAQLLQMEQPGRYQIHDLLRLMGRELAAQSRPGEVDQLVERACDRLLERARRANASLPGRPIPPPPAPRIDDPIGFLGMELANIMSCIGFAVSHGNARLAAELAVAMGNFCLMRGYTDQWEHSHRLVLAHADHLSPAILGMVELGMGSLYRFRDRNRESLAHLRRARAFCAAAGDRVGEAVCLLSWGVAVRMLGRLHAAEKATAAAVELLRQLPDETMHLGYALLAQHHLHRDFEGLRRALAIFEAHDEAWGAAEVHTFLADFGLRAGDLASATDHVNRAINLYGGYGDHVNLTAAQLQLAQIHLARRDYDRALPVLRRALRVAREVHHPWCQARAHRLLGQLMMEKGDAAQAVSHLDLAVKILRVSEQPLPLAYCLELLARAHASLGDHVGAQAVGWEAHELLSRLRSDEAQSLADWLAASPASASSVNSPSTAGPQPAAAR